MIEKDIEIIDSLVRYADYLGTGSSSKDADDERTETIAAWERLKLKITPEKY